MILDVAQARVLVAEFAFRFAAHRVEAADILLDVLQLLLNAVVDRGRRWTVAACTCCSAESRAERLTATRTTSRAPIVHSRIPMKGNSEIGLETS